MTSGAPQCIEEEDSRNEAVNIKSEAELESSDNESWYEKEDANTFFVKQENDHPTLREEDINQSSFSQATHQKKNKNKTVKVKVKVKERKTESNLSFVSSSFLTTFESESESESDSESDEHDHDLFTPTSSSTSKRRRRHRTISSSCTGTKPKTVPKTKRKRSRLNPWKPFELELNVGEKRPSPLRIGIGFGFGFGFGFGPCRSLDSVDSLDSVASSNSVNSVNSGNSGNSWPRKTSQVKAAWTRTRLVVARPLKSQNDPQLERVDASLTQSQSHTQTKETLVVIKRKNEQKVALEVGETDPFNELTQVGPTYTWKILKHRDALERVVDYDQVVKVIQGELEVRFRRNAKGYMIAGEGDCVFLPAHVLYTLINASSLPTEFEYFSSVRTTSN